MDKDLTLKILSRQGEITDACRKGLNGGRTASLSTLFSTYVRQTGFLSATDPDSPEIDRSLAEASHAAAALFQVAVAPPGAEVEVTLGGNPPLHLRNTLASDLVNVGDWRNAFLVCLISRNAAALDALCQVPVDLLRRSVSTADPYYFLYAEALQAWWRDEQDAGERLLAALEATDPDGLPEPPIDFVLHIIVPEMGMLLEIMSADADGFNTALAEALELHKKYYQAGDRKRDPTGFLALGPLAMCCFAMDNGLPVTVQSDYLLPRFIENAAGGE